MMREMGEADAVATLYEIMKHGPVKEARQAAETWLAYCRGRPTQAVEMTGKDGAPLHPAQPAYDLSKLSDAVLAELEAAAIDAAIAGAGRDSGGEGPPQTH